MKELSDLDAFPACGRCVSLQEKKKRLTHEDRHGRITASESCDSTDSLHVGFFLLDTESPRLESFPSGSGWGLTRETRA